jgi:pimeloyl-ACP methyl ester carboxylesterase
MLLTHYIECPLTLGSGVGANSSAIFARDPVGKAVVFIHGYGGNSVTTWAEFATLLPAEPKAQHYDFIFYGYDGLYGNATPSGLIFRDFLNDLFMNPTSIINPHLSRSAARDPQFKYDKIIIVAHSLGAVISRLALLLGHRERKQAPGSYSWLSKTAMIFYAPADMGAHVVLLAEELAAGPSIISTVLRFVGVGGRFVSPLIDELKENSAFLTRLQQDIEQETRAQNTEYLRPIRIIMASTDRIVATQGFPNDPVPRTLANTTHRSVCKPLQTFLDPLDELREIL